jgi:hypothetical protein
MPLNPEVIAARIRLRICELRLLAAEQFCLPTAVMPDRAAYPRPSTVPHPVRAARVLFRRPLVRSIGHEAISHPRPESIHSWLALAGLASIVEAQGLRRRANTATQVLRGCRG